MRKTISFVLVAFTIHSFGMHPFFDNIVHNVFKSSQAYQDFQKQKPLDFSGQRITKEMLKGKDLTNANFDRCIFEDVNLDHQDLTGASLVEADLRKVSLVKTVLKGTNLTGALLIETNLSQADFSPALLPYDNVPEPLEFDFSLGTDMFDIDRYRAQRTNLTRANMEEANLTEAWIEETDFTETNIGGVKVSTILTIPVGVSDQELLNWYYLIKNDPNWKSKIKISYEEMMNKDESERVRIKLGIYGIKEEYHPSLVQWIREGKTSYIHLTEQRLYEVLDPSLISPEIQCQRELANLYHNIEKDYKLTFVKSEHSIIEAVDLKKMLERGKELCTMWGCSKEFMRKQIIDHYNFYIKNSPKDKTLSALKQILYSKGLIDLKELYPDLD